MGMNSLALPDWYKTVSPEMPWHYRHLRFLDPYLMRIESGELKNLMLFMPPQHLKSWKVTIHFSVRMLELNPYLNIICGSYNETLAKKFSRRARKIARSRIALAKDAQSVSEWETAVGGMWKAVGVGSGVTGFTGDGIIVDDPVKSHEEAYSKRYRDRVWDWWEDDLLSRTHDNTWKILIMTRWHSDDLAGRLIKEMQSGAGEQWEIVSLPALAKENDPLGREIDEPLCPEHRSKEFFQRLRHKASFPALYQQEPVPTEGAVFKREWFKQRVERMPLNVKRKVRGYDLALSVKQTADYTASGLTGFDASGNLYIDDVFWKRISYPDQKKFIIKKMLSEPRVEHAIEEAFHGLALIQDLRTERKIRHIAFKGVRVDTDKLVRAQAWANLAEEGKVILVNGPWIEPFLDILCNFTGHNDEIDDPVDAISVAVRRQSKRGGKLYEC